MIDGQCHCGKVTWRFDRVPKEATVCNCTICRRYGAIWAYDFEGEAIHVSGETRAYVRIDDGDADIGFHFCMTCGCMTWWRGVEPRTDGRRRIAVNVRMAEPERVAGIPLRRFDGLGPFVDLPRDGKCVADMWA